MPTRSKRPCSQPGCPALQPCPTHSNKTAKDYDRSRGTATERGYDSAWSRFAAIYRADNPLCSAAQRQGRTAASEHVDHIIPLTKWRGDKYDPANLQPLSQSAHATKTLQERNGNSRGEPLASWPYVPWKTDLTMADAHSYLWVAAANGAVARCG